MAGGESPIGKNISFFGMVIDKFGINWMLNCQSR